VIRNSLIHSLLWLLSISAVSMIAVSKGFANPCNRAAVAAAARTGVPLPVLMAVTLAETGRKQTDSPFEPWPWAVQSQNRGYWFASADEAIDFVGGLLSSGEDNIDVGCFQLNIRWHRANFSSLREMLDPDANATYAAEFLLSLYSESGSWRTATGAYHSRNISQAEPYLTRLEQLYAVHLARNPPPPAVQEATSRPERFSLRGSVAPLIARASAPVRLIGRRP
tara:strand:- start:8528 stop:9199 length:672 start_codon:yes stop_codon:yes gene_type:complete